MFGFCSHKFVKASERTWICEKCGKIKQLPCEHEFEFFSNLYRSYSHLCPKKVVGYIFKCKKCGVTQQTMVSN